jgi:hypothetical protein
MEDKEASRLLVCGLAIRPVDGCVGGFLAYVPSGGQRGSRSGRPARLQRCQSRARVYAGRTRAFSKARTRKTTSVRELFAKRTEEPLAADPTVTSCLRGGFDSRMGMRHVPRFRGEIAAAAAAAAGAAATAACAARGGASTIGRW